MVETALLAAGASAGTAATAGSIASVIGTGFSIASSISGGNQQAAVYKAQARQNELSARQEEIKGRDQADKIRRSLQATLSSQNAAFAARGISLSNGTPVNIGATSRNEASYDINVAQFGAGMAAASERGTAAQNRISASAARTAGYGNAAMSLYKSGSLL